MPIIDVVNPVQEHHAVKCGVDVIRRGQVLRMSTSSDNVTGVTAGSPGSAGDGCTAIWCEKGYTPHGIAMDDARRGETLRMLVFGFCEYLLTDGNVREGDGLYVGDLVGLATGFNRHDRAAISNSAAVLYGDDDLMYLEPFGTALQADSSAALTAAWVSFK